MPSRTEYEVLSLTIRERTGREIAKEFERQAGRPISFGTLYTTLRRMKDAGWVAVRDSEDEDGRLRWFRLKAEGARALARARTPYSRDPLARPAVAS